MIIAFIIIQILLDLYFLYFIILANTALQIIQQNIPDGIKTYLTDVSKALLVKAGLLDRRLK